MKYKINYLTAGRPRVNDLKNINIFEKNTIANELLDPINGFFFLESNALNNYYKYGDDEYPISEIIRNDHIFHVLDNNVIPSNNFSDMTPYKIGEFLGIQFYNLFILPEIKQYYGQNIDNLKYLKNNVKFLNREDKKDQFIKFSMERLTKEPKKISIQFDSLEKYNSFKDEFLKELKNIISTTNIQAIDIESFIKETKDICDKIIKSFDKSFEEKVFKREGKRKINIQKKVNDSNDQVIQYYEANKQYFRLVESNIKDILKKKKKEEGKFMINYTLTSTLEDLNEIERDNFIAQYTLEFFSIFLSILWYKSSNKNPDIKSYYSGIFEILGPYKNFLDEIGRKDVIGNIIPLNFINTNKQNEFTEFFEQTFEDFNLSKNNFQYNLAKKFIYSSPSINLQEQKYSNIHMPDPNDPTKLISRNFPDCGEVSSRNFVKILCFNNEANGYDIEKLKKYGASDDLIKYFQIYKNEDKINSDYNLEEFEIIKTINGIDTVIKSNFNSRDAWNLIVSGLDNVSYNDNFNNLEYEIKSGTSKDGNSINMLVVLNHLFPNLLPNPTSEPTTHASVHNTTHQMVKPSISSFEDFNNDDIELKFKEDEEEKDFTKGEVTIEINETMESYIFHLEDGHYWIEFDDLDDDSDDSDEVFSDDEDEDKVSSDDEDEEEIISDAESELSIKSKLESFNNCLDLKKDIEQCFNFHYSEKLLKIRKINKSYFYFNFLKENFNIKKFDIDNSDYNEVLDEILKIWKYNKFFYLYYSFFSNENLLNLIHNKIFTLILTPMKRNIYKKYIDSIINLNNGDLIARLKIDYNLIENINDSFKIIPWLEYEKGVIIFSTLYNLTNDKKFDKDIKSITLGCLAEYKGNSTTEKINFLPDDLENLEILQNFYGLNNSLQFLDINKYVLPSKLKKLTYYSTDDSSSLNNVFSNLTDLEELYLNGWYGKDETLFSQLKLPSSLKKISFGDEFDSNNINDITFLKNTNLNEINFGLRFRIEYFRDNVELVFPRTLENLSIYFGGIIDNLGYKNEFSILKDQIKDLKNLTIIFLYSITIKNYDYEIKNHKEKYGDAGLFNKKKYLKAQYFDEYFKNLVGEFGLGCFMNDGLYELQKINFIFRDDNNYQRISFVLNTKIYTMDEIKSEIYISPGGQLTDEQLNNKITDKLKQKYENDKILIDRSFDYNPFLAGYYNEMLGIDSDDDEEFFDNF